MSSIDVRIGTTKVKTGCLVCRSRRIKCDEEWELGFCQRCSKSGLSGPYDAHTTRSRQTAAVLSPSSLSDSCIDPFGTLPVDCQYALENLFRIHFWRMGPIGRESYIRYVFNNPMLFETLIVFSKMTLRHSLPPEQRMAAEIRAHIPRLLREMHSCLTTDSPQMRELTALTAYYLAVSFQAAGDFQAFRIHSAGLQKMVSLGLPSELNTSSGFLMARSRSTEIFARYLTDMSSTTESSSTMPLSDSSYSNEIPSGLWNDFEGLIESGKLTSQGTAFLRNAERFLGSTYSASPMDKMSTLLALRMVESCHVTMFPAHAIFTPQALAGSS